MSVVKNTVYNLTGSVIPLLLALVTIPIYLLLIGPERYGALAIAWLILGYFGMFDLGLGRAVTQRIAALNEASAQKRADVFWTASLINVGISILGSIAMYFGAQYFFATVFKVDDALRLEILLAVPILAGAVPIITMTAVASGALQARQKFLEVNLVTVLSSSLFQLAPLAIAFLFEPNFLMLIIAAVFARTVGLLILCQRVYKHILMELDCTFDKTEWLTLLSFGSWVTVSSIIGPIMYGLDRFLIGAWAGAAMVALYTIPFQLAQRFSIIPQAFNTALFPKLSGATAEERQVLAAKSLPAILTLTWPIVALAILILPFILPYLMQGIYSDHAAKIGQYALIGWWVVGLAMTPLAYLHSRGKARLTAAIHIIEVPLYIVVLYISYEFGGITGVAVAFLARCVVDLVVMIWFSSIKNSMILNIIFWTISLVIMIEFSSKLNFFTTVALVIIVMCLGVFCNRDHLRELRHRIIGRVI